MSFLNSKFTDVGSDISADMNKSVFLFFHI